ncbi:MAG TPA: GxxExxY protein [Blastocatellia bacterium]|nr:GxxExxY protein [Blastocatellia bacterium]
MTENEIATIIVDTAFRIHRDLGPGLFESVYERIMEGELTKRGLTVKRQNPIPIVYHGVHFEAGFRCDLLVEGKVIVEVKSIEAIHPVHKKQVLTYLRFSEKRLGLLINFNVALIKDGIVRLVNGLGE